MQVGNAVAKGQFLLKMPRHSRSGVHLKMAERPHIANAEKINFTGYDRSVGLSPVTAPAVGGFWGGEAGAAGGACDLFWGRPKPP
ncbi:hypothetical protein GA0061098_1015101 [Bradyrhizobium shewense]|uniref:Uncharacterized protein n=1 Tax=Bradyrhizobium shewense TaxID=1761772 RepID=A0A1C3XGC5_9BRAD|nr:hypothetical protein GA0061098_1015101 [Bradyrhizobium shewense]